jgi:hypothetical protein
MLYAGECLVITIPYYQVIFRFLILKNPFISQPDNLNFFIQRSLNLLANPIGFEIINAAILFLLPILVYRLLRLTRSSFDRLGVFAIQIQFIRKGLV